ncbi:Mn2+ homeostasis protein (Per1) [Rhizoctonia solani AG-3 Rhs1AP]|uniref:Post-GPI attachment to proteins factor 3 n=2 Tax=Rhizoctonia solani AG-3 TaxID=1086053 RepID=A0A074SB36_9AGAM|nr:Mn2+ homeostasis protein (Per1) [Rhizoctonia solani AG-3 Rhs1AP]KEP54800.1 Mn2+ homeostasis protein (Per1) [Rhizoctonia solani 123E]
MILPRLLCSILPLIAAINASSGDRSPPFQQCLSNCVARTCTGPNGASQNSDLPLALRLTRWTCADDCKYQCMHILTDIALKEQSGAQSSSHLSTRIHQYYGKWPFWRFAGMQEPASVLFSVLNLVTHAAGMKKILKEVPKHFHMRSLYLIWSGLAVNAWVWSSVFHTRDTPVTEMLDYFSAGLVILYSLFFTVVRLFHLRPLTPNSPSGPTYKLWAILCGLMYLGHISYLTLLPRFDYTYNMAANLVIGLIHNALWLLYPWGSIRLFPGKDKHYRPNFSLQPALFVLLTTLATSLELFDFPPWCRTIDAHALWHLATVPIVPIWYRFLVKDALDSGWRSLKM